MATPTVSLAIIAKDEFDKLEETIGWYGNNVDEVHIAIDVDVPKGFRYKDNIYWHKYKWRDDFAHKRNFLASKIKTEYYVTIDTDDEIQGIDNLSWILDNMQKSHADIVLCWYNYNQDSDGNCILGHYKETVIRNTNKLYWKGRLHESVVCDDAESVKFYKDEDKKLVRVHRIDEDHSAYSKERNIRILKLMVEDEKDKPDPRTLALLGRTYTELGRFSDAVPLLDKHISISGWDEDKYISWLYLAKCLEELGHEHMAVDALFEAIKEIPEFPMAYAQLCEYYHKKDMSSKAIEYGTMAVMKPQPDTNMGFDPSLIEWKIPLYLAINYMQVNDTPNAIKYFAIAKRAAPNSEDILNFNALFVKSATHYDYMNCFLKLLKFTKDMKGDIKSLVGSIPQELRGHEMIEDLCHHYLPGITFPKGSVVIYCGATPHMWGPESIKTGIGGSEEATIWMARELVNLGRKVFVYCNCEESVVDEGVQYHPHCKFNRNDTFDNLVSWRFNMSYFDIKARNNIMWIHDIPRESMLTKDKVENLHKIIVLSEYHRSLLPKHLRNDKRVVISTNGLVPSDFTEFKDVVKVPKKLIYASSYDRGLETIVKSWDRVLKAHPEATLDIYYGWQTYDSYVSKGIMDDSFKQEMLPLFQQKGIKEHGRIGHRDLLEAYAKASVFAYPCNYTGEINCIAISKAIASGCNIITNDFAVMAERSPNAVSNVMFLDEMIDTIGKPVGKQNTDYIEELSWHNVAKQWCEDIL